MSADGRYGVGKREYDEVCFAGHSLALLGTNWTKDLSDWSSGNDHLSGKAQWDY